MRIVRLISDLKLIEARLRVAILCNESSQLHAELLRRAAQVMDRIEAYQADSHAELREQIEFFVQRATRGASDVTGRRDMDIALGLINRHRDQLRLHPASGDLRLMDGTGPTGSPRPDAPIRLRDWSEGNDSLSAYVSRSDERLAVLDSSYRYLATSAPNARFNAMPHARIISSHLAEIVGDHRFRHRAKPRIDRCLSGQTQEYYYDLPANGGGNRIIRCQMKPVHDDHDQLYCGLMYLTDVTESVAALQRR